jgi:hypothetical protein
MKMVTCKFAQNEVAHQRLRVGSKKHALSLPEGSVQQGHSHFYARSVHPVREHGKMARTPLAAFFNRPNIYGHKPLQGKVPTGKNGGSSHDKPAMMKQCLA